MQSFQEAAAAFKQTAAQIERTSFALERASLVFELDVPGSVSAFERLCAETETVVQLVNLLTGARRALHELLLSACGVAA